MLLSQVHSQSRPMPKLLQELLLVLELLQEVLLVLLMLYELLRELRLKLLNLSNRKAWK